jgi:hypothetical protein
VGSKIDKITRIFDEVEYILKTRDHLLGRKEWANIYLYNWRLKKPVFVAGQLSGQTVAYYFWPNK